MARHSTPLLSAALGLVLSPVAEACTQAIDTGANGQVITARSMDFAVDIPTDLWVMPRGTHRPSRSCAEMSIGGRKCAFADRPRMADMRVVSGKSAFFRAFAVAVQRMSAALV
jgi:hypothetical protein